jgi:amino acid adenylation domain-containing protein
MSRQDVADVYPLSPGQQAMLLYLVLSGSRAEIYFNRFVLTLGPVDPAVLRRAWQRVVDRHPALRTLFLWEKQDQPLQAVRRQVELPWQEHDWRDLPEAEREERLATFLREDHARGFELNQAPLTRVALIRWTDEESKLVWSYSHLVLDGWSLALVVGELRTIYTAWQSGGEPDLPASRPYRDYISWLKRQDPERAAVHWRRALAGFDPPTPLPCDGTGTPSDSGWASAQVERRIGPGLAQGVQALARLHQITPNSLFQGLWGFLLGRWSAVDDVVYGAVVSGRPHELDGVESMVGLFINTLPVRLRVDPAAELIPWLQRLQDEQFEQRELEYSSHEQILVWAGLPRHTPLFESLLVYENFPVDPMGSSAASGGLRFRSGRMTEANNVPLTLYVFPSAAGYDLKLSYHWNRFSGEAAERILDGLETLLAAVLAAPEARLGDLALVGPRERAELIAAAAGPHAGPARLPVHRRFQLQAARTPDAVAVTSALGTLTYRELDRSARRLAGRLRAAGVGPESIVGLCAERSVEMVAGMLAILEAGGAYLPLDPAYPPERLSFMLDDSGARVLLAHERLLAKFPSHRARIVLLDGAAAPATSEDPPPSPELEADLSRLAYVIYTSGSTGRPKGVLVPHASLAHYAESAAQVFGIAEADRVLQFASISFDTSGEEIYPCLTRGATLVLRDDEMVASLDRFAREVGTLGVTVLDLPTAYWHELVAEGLEMPVALRLVILGGEQAQRDRLDAWRERVGDRIRLVNTYGPTEATIVSTRRELSGPAGADFSGEIPIGRPIEDACAYVAGPGQELMPAGLDGELLIGGAGLARGYLGRPDLTAERFVPDPYSGEPGARLYRTGDLVRLGPGGDLQFRGRTDHQVKVRGYRIELGEIEAALRAMPAVRDAVVVAREAQEGGQRLTAYVVAAAESAPTPAELSSALRAALPDYMVPAAFALLGDLPRTPSGKVDRRAVARLPVDIDKGRPDLEAGLAAPRNQIEEVLCGIWSHLLGVERIGIHDDFFQLGGHSLLVAKLASRVRQAFHAELSMVEVFKTPTVAALAVAIQKADQAEDVVELPPIRRAPRDRPIPLSFPQERVWFLDQLSAGGNIAYNFQVTIWFKGPLEVAVLHRTLTEIVRRHEVLRTSFPVVDGQPVQVIHPAGPVDLPVIDLSQVPPEERKALAEEIFFATAKVPFDLSRAPLIRWRLLCLADDLWELIQIEHHFVHDGWSFAVLLQEIKAIYPAFLRGEPSHLPEPAVQYADFAVWQREWMAGPVMDRLLGFWTRKLVGAPRGLEIATDRPRPARGSFAGDVELFHLPLDLYDALRKLSRREGFTLYMTMLAGFFALLQRYTGELDMVIGTSNANRTTGDIEGMIGMVVNSLLLRGDLAGNPGFRELLGRVRELTLEVYAHQDMPFERLVQELRPERQLGRNPLFQIMYNFHDAAVPDLEFGNLEAHFAVRSNRSAKMDMNVIVIPRAEQRAGLAGPEAERWAVLFWEYNTDLFDRSTILRMIGHYLTLLGGAVADAGLPLSELPLLTVPERQELLADWGMAADYSADCPAKDALHNLFAAQAERRPAAVAVTMGAQRLTYGELNRRANRLAHRLRALGVGPEVPVPLCVERSLDLVVGILGILKAGGGYVPVDPSYPAERIDWILTDSQAGVASPVLVTQMGLAASLPASRAHVLCLDAPGLETESDADPQGGAGPDNLAYVIYTSGSTGLPKGVPIRHRHVARLFSATDAWFGFGPQDVWTLFHSFAFDFSVWEIWGALLHGGRLVVVPYLVSRSPEAFYLELVRERVTVLNQTPSAFRQLIAAEAAVRRRGEAGEDDLALRWVVFGGEALELGGLRPWFERHGDERPRLINMYGITETTVHVTYRPVTRADTEASGLGSRIGRPIPDLSVHLLDGDLNLVPAGVPGEIHVGGAGLSAGYLNRPDLTAERFIPDPFAARPGARLYRSGDLARVRPGGDLEYLGRRDHQVKIRGFRIELGEIEAALARHPAVREAAVLARAALAEDGGETRLVAYVVARSEAAKAAPAAQDLRQFLKASLPEHMIPSAFVVLDALPLTSHGKVNRKALPAPEAARGEAAETYLAPRSGAEETVAAIWSEVLGVERVGVRDDFFLLGGHSLAAARILSRVRDALGVDLSLLVVFETPTVEGMATAAAVARPSELLAGPPALAAEEERLVAQAAELSDADLDALLAQMITEGGAA